MVLYQKEREYITELQQKLATNSNLSTEEIQELIEKFEDMMEMCNVSVKIIDRLMHNYDKLKQQVNGTEVTVVRNA